MARKPKYLRYRPRRESLKVDKDQLSEYLITSLKRDLDDRSEWNDMRLQRYAKLRGWREAKDFPWSNASNSHIPFLMTECLRTQDTIHNAVLARHPVCEAMAILQVNQDKQKKIDHIIDHQIFHEQPGEEIVATLTQQFVQDGVFLAYVPWVRYHESVADIRILPPVPDDLSIDEAVMNGVMQVFPPDSIINAERKDHDGFAWFITYSEGHDVKDCTVEAYIEEEGGRLELCFKKEVLAYNGPVIMPKAIEDWVAPWRCANPQPPSPSNPGGADHFILLDYPKLDEIKRLYDEGYYDSLSDADMEDINEQATPTPEEGEENDALKAQKDQFEGIERGSGVEGPDEVSSHDGLTRLCCFLGWDVNGDGLEEQIVVWMVKENKKILRVRYLTEDYPSDPPLRPLAYAGFLPVADRIYAISQIELLESLHDIMKTTFDQMIDCATIKNVPWFFYRPMGGMKPETLHISPGEGVPANNPKDDIFIPQFNGNGEAFGLNMMTVLSQLAERASLQGDIQFGRVPQGKASALRTASGMQNLLAQGDARPERIMRRFFSGFKDIYMIIHELNQRFLPINKQYRLIEPDAKGRPVYDIIDDIEAISGRMQFEFKAGIFNTNKQMAQEILQNLMGMLINPLTLQLGVVTPQQVHNLLTDFIKLLQQEPTRYLVPPQPGQPKINLSAAEAINMIMSGRMPMNVNPIEGHQEHMKTIYQWAQQEESQLLSAHTQGMINAYLTFMRADMQKAQQQQQLMQNAQQFSQMMTPQGRPGPQGSGGTPNTGVSGNPPVQPNELINESLPGAR